VVVLAEALTVSMLKEQGAQGVTQVSILLEVVVLLVLGMAGQEALVRLELRRRVAKVVVAVEVRMVVLVE